MANGPNVFPAIIRAEYDPSGGFPKMVKDAQDSSARIRQQFESDFGQMGRVVKDALSKPLTAAGSLDLGVGQYKAAADAAALHARGLREVADAARRVADSDSLSPALRRQAQAASAAAIEAERLSRESAKQAINMDRLQSELDQTASSTQRLASAQRGMVAATAGSRQAYVGVGQQIADVAIQAQMGTNAFVILGQQGSQLAFQLSNAGGMAGRVATFFAGPWGAAVLGAASIAGLLATKLGDTADAADDVKFATNAVSDAQGILGNVMDLTTGKINTQIPALLALAKAQILVARVQAQTRAAEARRGVQDIQYRQTEFSGGMGGGFNIRRRDVDARDTISQQVLTGTLDSKLAIERLENLRKIGRLTDEQFAAAATSVANLGLELQNVKVFAEAEKLLDGTGGRRLLKPKKEKASRKTGPSAETLANRREALAEFGRDASDKIAGIRDRFGDAPTLLQRQAAALRELNDVQTDLEKRKPPELDKYLAQLSEARALVEKSLSIPFQQILATAREQAAVDDLLIDGREIEAEVLQRSLALQKQKGSLTKAEIEGIGQIVQQERLRSVEMEKRNESIARYQSVVSGTYGALEDLLSGGKAGDFFSSIRDQFQQLRGQNLAESLFGDAFRELKRFTERNNPENVAVRNLVEQTDNASAGLITFTDALLEQVRRITAANDNGVSGAGATPIGGYASESNPNGLIQVTGSITRAIRDGNRYSFGQFATATASGIINPLLAKLDETFGTQFFGQLSGVLTGALAGYARAGKVGGVLGGLQGIVNKLGESTKGQGKAARVLSDISMNLGKALGGAETGDQTAQLLRSFGVKTSRTGGQIGGAIGSFLPIPGGEIIGSIIGSVVGGMFKKTKKGSTTISNLTDDLAYTGSGKLKSGVLGLGGNVKSSLSNIIEALGGTAGAFSVSVGQRGKNFVVDPTGRGRTKGSGVQKFKTEEEAARAALMDAIMDGAVQGIKAGAQRLLQSGKDLDAQLQKAVKFQSVFDRLDAIKDPLGATIRTLDREFSGLRSIFLEAGEDMTALEELYGLERAKIIKEQSEALTGSLRSLIDDLTKGDSGLALRDRLANIRAEFDPLAGKIRAGETVDYDKFSELARQLIDVQRQISGSQVDYFATFNEILGLSQSALAGQQNVISIGSGSASPFSGSAPPSNASVPVVSAINALNGDLSSILHAINANIGALANNGTAMIAPAHSRLTINGGTYW